MAQSTDDALAHLSQLCRKPGVQSTLILSRETGAVLRTTGLVQKTWSPPSAETGPEPPPEPMLEPAGASGRKESGLQSAEDVASVVWAFLKAAGGLVDKLDADDEVKLLRLRMKKVELVIVPDPRFILVMIHDTPPV